MVLTHDHALDFLIVREALARGDAAYVGMIGSRTKRASFLRWLRRSDGPRSIRRALVCPIGAAGRPDKRPEVIAAFVAVEIMQRLAAGQRAGHGRTTHDEPPEPDARARRTIRPTVRDECSTAYFKLTEHGTNVRTEVIAGITTFLTMAYIIFVNPQILATTGMEHSAVFVATCLAAALGSAIMGLYANWPIAMAPGMGLNAFFAFGVVGAMGFTWQQALGAVFISGCIFLILTVTGVRRWLVAGHPAFDAQRGRRRHRHVPRHHRAEERRHRRGEPRHLHHARAHDRRRRRSWRCSASS